METESCRRNKKRKRRNSSSVVHCAIVDDHCDILPFVFAYYRAKKISHDETVIFLHIDAHPDLSIPSDQSYKNIKDWSDADRLYEIVLDSEGGIAEFIIPMFSRSLISQIVWVKPRWADQFPIGNTCFSVRDIPNSQPKVNKPIPYYIDDDAFKSTDPLEYGKLKNEEAFSVHLLACEASNLINLNQGELCFQIGVNGECNESKNGNGEFNSRKPLWVLDICLDYFSTVNPFWLEFEDELSKTNPKEKVCEIKRILSEIFQNFSFRKFPDDYNRVECWGAFQEFISFPNTSSRSALSKNLVKEFSIDELSSILPFMSEDSKQIISKYQHLLFLPHNKIVDEKVIQESIQELEKFIQNVIRQMKSCPMFITVARSLDDGYTPKEICDFCQVNVLEMIKRVITNELELESFVIIEHNLTATDCILQAEQILETLRKT